MMTLILNAFHKRALFLSLFFIPAFCIAQKSGDNVVILENTKTSIYNIVPSLKEWGYEVYQKDGDVYTQPKSLARSKGLYRLKFSQSGNDIKAYAYIVDKSEIGYTNLKWHWAKWVSKIQWPNKLAMRYCITILESVERNNGGKIVFDKE